MTVASDDVARLRDDCALGERLNALSLSTHHCFPRDIWSTATALITRSHSPDLAKAGGDQSDQYFIIGPAAIAEVPNPAKVASVDSRKRAERISCCILSGSGEKSHRRQKKVAGSVLTTSCFFERKSAEQSWGDGIERTPALAPPFLAEDRKVCSLIRG